MKLTLRSKYSVLQTAQLVLLFLVGLNILNKIFYVMFFAFFLCLIANYKHLKIDAMVVVLFLFSICYIVFFSPTRTSMTTILKQFSYPMCYMIGINLFGENDLGDGEENGVDDCLKISILVVALGSLSHYVLNALTNFNSGVRNTIDFWTGSTISATGQALLAVIAVGVFCTWILVEGQMWKKCLAVLGLIAVFAYNLILAGRTLIILSVIVLAVALVYTSMRTDTFGRIKKYLFLIGIALVVLFLFRYNAFGIRDLIMKSNFMKRFGGADAIEDSRFALKLQYIKNMARYPLGGDRLRMMIRGYAHELYLDAYNDVGVFGYILLIVFSIRSAMNSIRILRSNRLSVEAGCMLLCVFVAINIVFFLEPIMQGMPWLFCVFCFLSGLLSNLVSPSSEAS